MSKNKRQSQTDSRPPVDALQYEKLALSAFHLCDRQMSKLNTLITLASTICRNPAVTSDERRRQQTMLELLISTGEQYQQELACDRELFQVIALDAKGVAKRRITARRAARLLEEAGEIAAAALMPEANAGQQGTASVDEAPADDMKAGPGPGVTQH
ncbi:hypothetical protein [Paraburkholderia dilworthii]|uniref:hypothetical protein n=1 Tax=Paraburkholderia dilworthii TaxID=948106 RepID=UPI000483A3EA|nr:hypothetical protein [Paraburkholderia dilworthii]